jgi:HTH-type transcriptional regulator / antitoxin HigA
MAKKAKLDRDFLSKPGDTILDTIEYLKMSQAELAERMGRTAPKINDLISGKEPITTATAFQLERVLDIDADFWINREATYRAQLARIEEEEKVECWIPWAKEQPVRELVKCGYIKDEGFSVKTVIQLLLFYGVATPQQWETVCVPQYATGTKFRKSQAFQSSIASISAWLRMGEIEMRKLKLAEFNREGFKQALEDIKVLVVNHPHDFAHRLKRRCAAAGVAVVYTRCLPHAPISGATRWIGGNALIQLSDRYKTNDHFWFTFYHEAGHILLHGKKELFLEEAIDYSPDEEKEEEANTFAAKTLLPEKFITDVGDRISDDDIVNVATKYNTHPGVVVGRLQHIGRLPYNVGNKFKEKLSLFDD